MPRAARWLIDTAGSVTGTRFRLVVASSSTATALIIGSTLASGGETGLASQLAQALAALGNWSPPTPAATTPASTGPAATPGKGGVTGASATSVPVSAPAPVASAPTKTPKSKTPKAGRVKHVFLIALDSPGYDDAFGAQSKMPYLANTLRPQGELLPNYSLLTDTGLPNYIAMVGGQSPNALTSKNCTTYQEFPGSAMPDRSGNVPGDGCVYPAQAINVADQLFSARFSWGAYMEDMGKPEPVAQGQTAPANPPQDCVHPDSGTQDQTQDVRTADPSTGYAGSGYAARHNPFVYFHSLLDLGSCRQHDLPLDQLPGALASGTPNLTFISPNLCDSGEPTECNADVKDPGPAQADAFLSQWVPKILASPAYQQDGVLIITFGEATPAVNGAPVGTLLISKFLTPGSTDTGAFNPDSIFRTVEDLFGLQHIAAGARAGTTSFGSDLLGSQQTNKKRRKK
jgi:phosphatidylinositol-3-phosphatase